MAHTLCPRDCYDRCCVHNLWLWLLKARMMSTSVEINRNYSRTQFALRTDISGRRMWNTHTPTHTRILRRRRRTIWMKNTLQLSAPCDSRELWTDWISVYSNVELAGTWLRYQPIVWTGLTHTQSINIHQRQRQRHSTLRDIVIYKWAKC